MLISSTVNLHLSVTLNETCDTFSTEIEFIAENIENQVTDIQSNGSLT